MFYPSAHRFLGGFLDVEFDNMFWQRKRIEELIALINKIRKRDREFRTHFYKSLNEEKPVSIIYILVSMQYPLDRLEELYDSAAIINEYVTNEKAMENVLLIGSYKIQGLPHADYKKAEVIEKIVNRLCERSLDGNITIDDIVMKTEIKGINYEETKKLLEWMKRFDMVDEVEKNIFSKTEKQRVVFFSRFINHFLH